jgi:hypothetical protein
MLEKDPSPIFPAEEGEKKKILNILPVFPAVVLSRPNLPVGREIHNQSELKALHHPEPPKRGLRTTLSLLSKGPVSSKTET